MKLQDSGFKDRYGNPINIPQGAAVQFFGDWTKEEKFASAEMGAWQTPERGAFSDDPINQPEGNREHHPA